MKTTKWTKWQLGIIGAVGVAFLFREVKDSPNFALAAQQHQPQDKSLTAQEAQQQDPVMQEWRSPSWGRASDSDSNAGSVKRRNRSNRTDAGHFGGSSSSTPEAAPPGDTTMRTRTGRS
ncbi:hypothetical protein [Paenibacillus tyrfis]|uniref:hypothetical protein n=1 Tax=Paenibacillus tyrfis TaxID=1501230 RepID=UPI00209EE2A7|nr:hypothetical protein [Paenibacillus tyrfis]MCP1310241.1 hypothetical protein [Paenibacillus tyrfis]